MHILNLPLPRAGIYDVNSPSVAWYVAGKGSKGTHRTAETAKLDPSRRSTLQANLDQGLALKIRYV